MGFFVRTQNKQRIVECKDISYVYYGEKYYVREYPSNSSFCNLGIYDTEYKALFVLDEIQQFMNTRTDIKCYVMPQNNDDYFLKGRYPNCKLANNNKSIDDNNNVVNRPAQMVEDEIKGELQ